MAQQAMHLREKNTQYTHHRKQTSHSAEASESDAADDFGSSS